jgi:hypothetical protein
MPLLLPRERIVRDFPYPIARAYELVFDESGRPADRLWALCFTEYQLLRMVCLPLVGQYLLQPIEETNQRSIGALGQAISAIRTPFFSDWNSPQCWTIRAVESGSPDRGGRLGETSTIPLGRVDAGPFSSSARST